MIQSDGRPARGCRCEPCVVRRRDLDLQRQKARRAAVANGTHVSGFVDITYARTLVKELIDNRNWGVRQLAEAADVDRQTISRIRGASSRAKGQQRVRVRVYHALERLLELDSRRRMHAGRVETSRFQLAMRCAMAEGYTSEMIANFISKTQGVPCDYRTLLVAMRRYSWVKPEWEAGAVAFLEHTGGKIGPSTQGRQRALKKGWKPAIYYDEFV